MFLEVSQTAGKVRKTTRYPKMRLCNCKICLVCTCIPYVHTVYFFCTICTQGVRVLTGGQAASHSSSLFLFSYTRLLSGFIAFLKTNFNLLICNVKFHIFFSSRPAKALNMLFLLCDPKFSTFSTFYKLIIFFLNLLALYNKFLAS